jgi:hypothetical protein
MGLNSNTLSQPDRLRRQLMAACDELELPRLKHLLDTRALSILQEVDSDSLRFICGIRSGELAGCR